MYNISAAPMRQDLISKRTQPSDTESNALDLNCNAESISMHQTRDLILLCEFPSFIRLLIGQRYRL